eukprot:c19004_g1_i1 orf=488-2236(-)
MAESGGDGPADSYIGSLISLTSKSEIRYEGLLYTVDTENSNIALQNVRSFGTEGRKKNGPQIPAGDKVYEFIIFRGTDIKDLQVKMSPPPPIHNDPAIISLQAQASPAVPTPPPYVPAVADMIGNNSTYKASSVPYYHAANSGVALWAPPPPPQGPSGNMPLYWQGMGFYRPPDQHQILEPSAAPMQSPTPAQVLYIPVTPAAQSASAPPVPDQASAQPSIASNFTQPPPGHTPATPDLSPLGSMTLPAVESVHRTHSGLEGPLPVSSSQPSSSSSLSLESSGLIHYRSGADIQGFKLDEVKAEPHREVRSVGPSGVSRSAVSSPAAQTVRKGSFASGKGPMVYKQVYKQVQATKGPVNSGLRDSASKLQRLSAQPLLPLPTSPIQRKPLFPVHEGIPRTIPIRRGGSRGGSMGRTSRTAHSRSKLMEDFDFIAMNEKFNKEEVWDELLKVEFKDRVFEEGAEGLDYGLETKEIARTFDQSVSEFSKRSVYVKDNFFDSLSCDALDREHGRSERLKFSEQRRIDVETFGSFNLRSYHGGGGYHGRRGAGGGHGQGRNVGRGRGHGFGYYNSTHGDGRSGSVG